MRARAATALASALVLFGSFSSAALAADNGANNRKLDTSSGMTPDLNDPRISGDPDYGVCRGTDPVCYHNWTDDRQNKVLIYSRTAGPRHANINPALGPGLNPPLSPTGNIAQKAIIKWLQEADPTIIVNWTEDVNTFAGQLGPGSNYKAVIFLSPTRDTLWKHGTATTPTGNPPLPPQNTTTGAHLDAGKTALRQFMRAGGGFVGIHNAFGTEYNWPYYEGLLGNANYYDHGANQDGQVVVVAQDPSTAGLPQTWPFRDEWYNLRPFPTKVKFLLTVDENTLATRRSTHPGHGKFHPVAWCQYYDGGRVWVTTLGHDGQAFTDGSTFPGQAEFKSLIVKGILSAMGNTDFCTYDHRQRAN
jgi:type 1 glutamine amidotransferase